MKKSLLLFATIIFCFFESRGIQVITQSFDATPISSTLPLGWLQGKIGLSADSSNMWNRSGGPGTHSGAGMLYYQSGLIPPGEAAFIASPRLDMRNSMPVGGASFNFWMYRNWSGSNVDRIQVYVNDSAVISGGVNGALLLTENITGASAINASCGQSPTPVACIAWNNYFYTIPNVSPFNGGSVYIIVVATSDNGQHIYIDDFTINSYPVTQSYVANSASVIQQNLATTSASKTNQMVIGCKLTMSGGLSPRILSDIEFNTNGSTNPTTDITNAKLWFTAGTPSLNMENAVLIGTYSNPWLTNYAFLTFPNPNYSGPGFFNQLVHGDNYFWITYDIAPGAVLENFVDAEWVNFQITWATQTPTSMTLAGNRMIDVDYCEPMYQLGICGWGQTDYSTHIHSVVLPGDNIPSPGINNDMNYVVSWCTPNWNGTLLSICPPPYPRYCPFQCSPPSYELFAEIPGKTTRLTANGTTSYSISLQAGTYPIGNALAAWIDFNHDGDFYDAGEKIAQSGNLGALATYTTTFTVPFTATPGKTRLRVRQCWINYNMDPCATHTYGEAEDYVVTIVPDCPSGPGWTTWMGLSDDWANPNNWCPAIVPMLGNPTTNVRIPGGPSAPGYTYHRPVIKSNMQARAGKLLIETNDSVYVDAASGSSLTVFDSLKIAGNNSALIVKDALIDTAQVMNGMLNRPLDSPLNSSQRSRSFISYTQAELLSKGMIAGDRIIKLRLHLQRKSNGNAYRNFEVKYFYTTNAQALFTAGYSGNIPLPTGAPATPVTIFSGILDVASTIPNIDDYGTVEITLSTPLTWNGGANPLIFEICYDNTGFPLTGVNDEIRSTQTTSLRRYMNIESLSTYVKPGCSLSPKDTVMSLSSGTSGSNLLTVNPADAADIFPGQLTSLGLQVVSISGNTVTLNGNLGSNYSNVMIVFYNSFNTAIVYRPNITFEFYRSYTRFPVLVAGHWENNGTFTPAYSSVTMNGTIANQKISGASSTTFYDLKISNSNHVLMTSDVSVTDSLLLALGRLKLNNKLMTLTNPGPGILNRTSGYIQSETDAIGSNISPFGRLNWQMGSITGMHIIPFVSTMGEYLPLDYNVDSGTHDVTFATYRTLANNTNLPLPEVTSIAGLNNATGGSSYGSDGWAMADRYFMINNAGTGGQADITFRFAATEQAQGGNVNMKLQRWMDAGDQWEFPFQPGQTFTAGAPNSIQLTNYTGFNSSTWWTITGNSSPLPVTLLDFYGEKVESKVRLRWTTASEINSSHFDVERTVDNNSFKFIERVESKGAGNNIQNYEAWDNSPVDGIQYYYLYQYDLDGNRNSYGPVSVKFDWDVFNIVTTTVSPTEGKLTVVYNYNSTKPISCIIMDVTGRVISRNDQVGAVPGMNVLELDADLSRGTYFLLLQNSDKTVNKRFFY